MRRYRVLLPLEVHTTDGSYKQGDEFEHEFTVEDEKANLDSGLLELVPQTYKVIGETTVHDTKPGGTFAAALPMGVAELLLGSHIELVEDPKPTPKPSKSAAKTKE